jgi:hypothetical protein
MAPFQGLQTEHRRSRDPGRLDWALLGRPFGAESMRHPAWELLAVGEPWSAASELPPLALRTPGARGRRTQGDRSELGKAVVRTTALQRAS